MRLAYALPATLALLAACGDDGGDPAPGPEIPDAACTGRACYDAKAYALEGKFDWAQGKLLARETLTLQLTVAGGVVVDLDSEVKVSRVRAGDKDLDFSSPDERTLRIDLRPLTDAAEPVTFTIEYEASVSRALVTPASRDGDPVATHLVYTNSEPIFGSRWLPAKHDPADRAQWSVALTLAADEDLVANGERIVDTVQGKERVVRYEMDQPLPTYMMAFAAGHLVHTDVNTGRVPLSLWYRRGLVIDPAVNLGMVADQMATFERLLGPYPFDSYAVVLLPGFPGGMENATITFNDESSGLGAGSFGLNAHELGHHWFGDWVTMRRYDDVWIKEGMATLLAAEATRARRDSGGTGRFFGSDFRFTGSAAVVDTGLTGLAKYTSGPYQRAAWTLSQIRARIGEEAFWSTLRRVLEEHALDSVDTETFVRSFAPALDEATILKVLASLDEHVAPTITGTTENVAEGVKVTLTVSDPSSVLLAPIDVTLVDADGKATVVPLPVDLPVDLVVPPGGYLAPDERDLMPSWRTTFKMANYYEVLSGNLLATAPGAVTAFTSRSPAHQERAAIDGQIWAPSAEAFAAIYAALDSTTAKEQAFADGCWQMTSADDPAPWLAVLEPIAKAPALERMTFDHSGCGAMLAPTFKAELTDLVEHPTAAKMARLEYLMSFSYGPADDLALMSKVATQSPSLQLRDDALDRLSQQALYVLVPDDQRGPWRTFFRDRIPETTSDWRLLIIANALGELVDVPALPQIATALRRIRAGAFYQREVVCSAHRLAGDDAAAWKGFQDTLQPWTDLDVSASERLADRTKCDQ